MLLVYGDGDGFRGRVPNGATGRSASCWILVTGGSARAWVAALGGAYPGRAAMAGKGRCCATLGRKSSNYKGAVSSRSSRCKALRTAFSSSDRRLPRVAMAATSVMWSVVAAGAVTSSTPAASRTSASYNVLLSSHRASFKTGVAVPAAVRSSSLRTEPKRSLTIVAAKATKEPETTVKTTVDDSSAALEDVLKKVQEAWEKTDDKVAITGLGVAGLVALWASAGLINAIDKLPLIPDLFEIVGILFSGWFVYRYLLFKPDREELFKIIDEIKSKITGQ